MTPTKYTPSMDVHVTRCCKRHGCKYGDEDCPVVLGKVNQKYGCEVGNWDFKRCTSKDDAQVTLEDLPAGSLFKFDDCIALKSEYTTKHGAIEAYIVGSGELFWGGATTPSKQRKLLVTPITFIKD